MCTLLHVIRASIACSLLLAGLAVADANDQEVPCDHFGPLTFGFLPLVSSEKLVQRFAPLVHYLSAALHTPVRIETAADFDTFIQRTNDEKRYDLLFTAPHLFYLAREKAGYHLLVSVDAPGMSAIIVAPQHSQINTIRDLAGRKLATVDPMSLATLLVRKQLEENGLDPDTDLTLVTTPSHNASLLSSYYGATDASSLMMPPFMVASPKVRKSMRVIAVTESTPHMPISTAPWIDPVCRDEMTAALLTMPSTAAGQEALDKAGFQRFIQSSAGKYDALKWAAEQIDIK
ncbi:MAG: phosphate/phosphite/phosphonate ABC transporter substrate-binding protein [Gammaproteobacteria bacterium]